MPAPRSYIAIVVTWLVLQFAAGISTNVQRAASRIAWVIVLAGMVIGPFGQTLVSFMSNVANGFPTSNVSSTDTSNSTTPSTVSV